MRLKVRKERVFQFLKWLAYFIGFPTFLLMCFFSMMPMFGEMTLGNSARNWMLILVGIWLAVEITRFLLNKFVGKKNEAMHKVVLGVMAIISICAVILPPTIFQWVEKPKYNTAKSQLSKEIDVWEFDSVTGWNRGLTDSSKSGVVTLIKDTENFMNLYSLNKMYSEWYGNADKEHNLGYKIGTYEKIEKLIAEKKVAQAFVDANKPILDALEAEYKALQTDYKTKFTAYEKAKLDSADPANDENVKVLKLASDNAKLAIDNFNNGEKGKQYAKLKGAKIDLTIPVEIEGIDKTTGNKVTIKTTLKETLVADVMAIVSNVEGAFPDGLVVSIAGVELPLGDILKPILNLIPAGTISPDLIRGIVPDYLYTSTISGLISSTGISLDSNSVAAQESVVKAKISLDKLEKLDFQLTWYPKIFAAGAVKFYAYICVGLMVFSIYFFDYLDGLHKKYAGTGEVFKSKKRKQRESLIEELGGEQK